MTKNWRIEEELTTDQLLLKWAAQNLQQCRTIEDAAAMLRSKLIGWLVYLGGHHVAVHLRSGDPTRRLLIVEAAPQ